jgi:hypothetical protein
MATGTATVNFGTGKNDTTVVVTGQTGILTTSMLDAWVMAAATSDNRVDEHWVEDLEIVAGNISAGVGFTIYAVCRTGKAFGNYNVQWAWV